MNEETKSKIISIRVSPTEKKKIEEQAELAHMSVANYLITLSESKKIIVIENIPQLMLEITRIGTNINQIAHVANSQKYINRSQLDEAISLLTDVKADMQKILSELYNDEEHTIKSLERKIDKLIERMDNNGDL